MINTLDVTLDFGAGTPRPLGRLARDPQTRRPVFEWNADFAANPLPIWPVQAERPSGLLWSERGVLVHGLFEDSLPDGWGKLLLDREIQKQGVGSMRGDDMARLAFIGRHGMGALRYAPENRSDLADGLSLEWFENLIPRVEGDASLDDLRKLRTAAGGSQGARPKFVAQMHTGTRALRDHRHPYTPGWIDVLIKARGTQDPPDAVAVECTYGAMMGLANIDTSPMFAMEGAQETAFATHRFDRVNGRRLHMATVAGLMDSPLQHGVMDYTHLLRLAGFLCKNHQAVEAMFRRMVFNARTHARDDHIRNHAFLMDENGVWTPSPAYDVTFETGPGGQHSMAIANEGLRPGPAAFAAIAANFRIKPKRMADIVDEVDAAVAQWPTLAKNHGVRTTRIAEIQSVFQSVRGWP